jgi:hypothetical protein
MMKNEGRQNTPLEVPKPSQVPTVWSQPVKTVEMRQNAQIELPKVVKLVISLTAKRKGMEEFVEDLDDLYKNWAIPELGVHHAKWWAYGQAAKAVVVTTTDWLVRLWERIKRAAK